MAGTGTGRRYEPEFMRGLLARAVARGWSLVRLARESGVSLPTLVRWRRRLDEAVAPPRFVELLARGHVGAPGGGTSASAPAAVEVVLRSGDRLLLHEHASESLLERVLRALSR